MTPPTIRRATCALGLAVLAMIAPAASAADGPGSLAPRTRRPVALAIVDGGKTVLVANGSSGSLSIVDADNRRVVAESDIGRGLSDLVALPDGRHLLAVDRAAGELLLVEYRERSAGVVGRVAVAPDPVRVVAIDGGSMAVVASTWSRRLTFVGLKPRPSTGAGPELTIAGSLDLPFGPREMAAFDGGSPVVVADAFGGRLAVVDPHRRALESLRTLPAHNIRGMAFSPDGRTLLLTHQVLKRLARTSFDDVHWGQLIRNHLRVLRVEALLKPGPDAALLDGGRLFDLGDVGYAAGDPGAIAMSRRGEVIVALEGMDEVALSAGVGEGAHRIVVGRRPSAVAISPDGTVAYVADALDDTISVVVMATGQRPSTIALGPHRQLTAADRGERLFSSARLSHDGWMSCQSCHTDGHTNGLACDTLGDGSYGTPKQVPSLFGVASTGPWTWTASMGRLEDQVRKSILTTMHGTKPSDEQVADLTVYLARLEPPAPRPARPVPDYAAAIARGREVFAARKCAGCHEPPTFTTPGKYDVGLADEAGNREFNPPSLRAVGRRDAFLHDGRAGSLGDVFAAEHHPRGLKLSPREIDDLVAFLESL
ncbi:MAG: cytochrome c peroxidase [Isosphaeraceae bacterium]